MIISLFIQVCGCTDEWSRLNCIVTVLRVLVDTAAEASWISDVLLHQHDVTRFLQRLITDCDRTVDLQTDAETTTHDNKLLAALISDSQKILALLTS